MLHIIFFILNLNIINIFKYFLVHFIFTTLTIFTLMLKQRPRQHKRKNSELNLFYPSAYGINAQEEAKTAKSKTKSKKHKEEHNQKTSTLKLKHPLPFDAEKHSNEGKSILKLIQNSQKRAKQKKTVIQDLNNHNNENIDTSNGHPFSQGQQNNDENYDSFFKFGRKPSLEKQNNYSSNINCLDMQEITQVPDTMSNERRYQNSNLYQFTTSNQNSLAKFSTKLNEEGEKSENNVFDYSEGKLMGNRNIQKKQVDQTKNLKQRKERVIKNIIIDNGEASVTDKDTKFDFSELMEKKKIIFCNKKDQQKSKERSRKVQKQKSKTSLIYCKTNKIFSQANLSKKKSFSLKNDCKLKISDKNERKPKSFQKSKEYISEGKTTPTPGNLKPLKPKVIYSSLGPIQMGKNMEIQKKLTLIQQSQSKLQNQYKVLWQCVGELWQNNRITRYISQKNKSDITKVIDNQKHYDQKLIKLKSQILSTISSARY